MTSGGVLTQDKQTKEIVFRQRFMIITRFGRAALSVCATAENRRSRGSSAGRRSHSDRRRRADDAIANFSDCHRQNDDFPAQGEPRRCSKVGAAIRRTISKAAAFSRVEREQPPFRCADRFAANFAASFVCPPGFCTFGCSRGGRSFYFGLG